MKRSEQKTEDETIGSWHWGILWYQGIGEGIRGFKPAMKAEDE